MLSDALLNFVPLGGNLSMVGAAGVAIPSTNVIDLLGSGVGTPPANIIGAQNVIFGEDPGVGGRARPEINCVTGTAFVTANAATLNVQLQYAPDPGVAGNYTPAAGAWVTVAETGAIAVANLGAGVVIARFPFLPAVPAGVQRPRFVRLNFAPAAATNFTAGTIFAATVTIVRDDQANRQAQRNFVVA